MLNVIQQVFSWVGNIFSFFLGLEIISGISLVSVILISYLVGALLVLLLNDAGASVRVSGRSAGNPTKGSSGK